MMNKKDISSDFPFESKYLEIKGSRMHYIDLGQGDPILFLHGNPTSSYLWRNIIPHLTDEGRCIAPDLIGMGKSDKPDIAYTFEDHYDYLVGFIEELDLRNITLVIHDWGSGLGFHYANTHRGNIKGIAFMEAMYRLPKWDMLPKGMKLPFRMFRAPFVGWLVISVGNLFVKKLIPDMIVRELSKEESDYYESPYPTISSRKPVRVWPIEIPFDGKPEYNYEAIESYSEWLQESETPKLLLYANPGGSTKAEDVTWIKNNIPNLKATDIGRGLHYIQEDNPHLMGKEIAKWYQEI